MPIKLMVESSILSSAWTSFFAFFLHLYQPPVVSRPKPAPSGPAEGTKVLEGGLARGICFVDVLAGELVPISHPTPEVRLEKANARNATSAAPLTRKAHHDAATRASQSSALRRRAAGGLASPQRSHSARPGPIYLEVRVPYPRAE